MTSRHDAPNTRYRFQPEVDGLLQAEARLPAAEGSTLIVSHSQRRQELPGLTKNAGVSSHGGDTASIPLGPPGGRRS